MTDAEPSGENENYRGVDLSSRTTLGHEIAKMRRIAMILRAKWSMHPGNR